MNPSPECPPETAEGAPAAEHAYDVVVVGGGTAGVIAAWQAALAGAHTALVELNGQLGGTLSVGGVAFPGLFHAWGRQVIAGLGWELVCRTVALEGGRLPDATRPTAPGAHWEHQVRVNAALYALLAEEACLRAGVRLYYYRVATAVQRRQERWQVELAGRGGTLLLAARQLVDCTGDADLVGLLGWPRRRRRPRQRAAERQPGTLMFRLAGYDPNALDEVAIQECYRAALAEGALQPGDYAHPGLPLMHLLRTYGDNCQHVFGADSSTSEARGEANVRGRQALLRLLCFVRTLPGCEQARLAWMAAETGVRETYRIVGRATVTADDYGTGRVYPDAVCYAFYPIDVHTAEGVAPRPLAPGVLPTVPLGALLPAGGHDLLVAGRCLSSDRSANSALRVQAASQTTATCMATGQVAGACAALAARQALAPAEVPLADLHALLRAHGAIVPGPGVTPLPQ